MVQDPKLYGDSTMRISILVWLQYVLKIFEKQDLAVATARDVVA
jgi:hypothetical protein